MLEIREQFRRLFDQHPMLLYDAAEANKVGGDDGAAEELAENALQIRPLPSNEAEREQFQPKQLDEAARGHYEIAKTLETRGLFHWSEREYRSILDAVEVTSAAGAQARAALAQMLGELERHRDVVDVLRPLLDRASKDAKLNARLNELYLPYNRFQSTMDYHAAMAELEDGKKQEASKFLERAFRLYPSNVDILIAMYRLDLDDDWNQSVRSRLKQTLRQSELRIESARSKARQFGNRSDGFLAQYMNEYAWLVSNTEGDTERALQYSLKSLELQTDFAKLDTCGRCYFALGQFDKAIEMQNRALKLMPHSPAAASPTGRIQSRESERGREEVRLVRGRNARESVEAVGAVRFQARNPSVTHVNSPTASSDAERLGGTNVNRSLGSDNHLLRSWRNPSFLVSSALDLPRFLGTLFMRFGTMINRPVWIRAMRFGKDLFGA